MLILIRIVFLFVTFCQFIKCELPPYWHMVPSSLGDFEVKDGATVIDPWNYLQRMGMYKILLTVTQDAMEPFGPNNTGNVLWGLPLQLGWQFSSKRSQIQGQVTNNNIHERSQTKYKTLHKELWISTESWWSNMNYMLSTVPFIGAMKAGLFEKWPRPIRILPPNLNKDEFKQKYCITYYFCKNIDAKMMNSWRRFFRFVKSRSRSVKTVQHPKHEIKTDRLDRYKDKVLKRLWQAHSSSLEAGLKLFGKDLIHLSIPEKNFGIGWGHLVHFIAAVYYRTDFNKTSKMQKDFLPKRILQTNDRPPFIEDMTTNENRALEMINILYTADKHTGGNMLKLWQKAMCTSEGRKQGRHLMETLLDNPLSSIKSIMYLIWTLIFKGCSEL